MKIWPHKVLILFWKESLLHLLNPHAPIWNLLNVILTFLQSFRFYNFTSFSSEECLTFSSDLVCQNAVLSSPLSSPYSPDTISPSLLFCVLAVPLLPSQGFFFHNATVWRSRASLSSTPLPLLAALILMLLQASICVFAAVTFIQYLSKNWSWACCSWSAEPEWWEGGGSACGGGWVLGGGCGWSTQEQEFWEKSAF